MAVAKQGILQKRIKKPSVANTVMQRVYDALLEGEIKPGDLLPSEAELSEQLNVGKSSVREAIKMLSAIGVVESVQGEGTFIRTSIDEAAVNPMTYQMVLMQGADEQILELRYCLEPAYTLLAMRKATPEDLEKIIIGGGISNEKEILFPRLNRKVRELMPEQFYDEFEIVMAQCCNHAGMLGAVSVFFLNEWIGAMPVRNKSGDN